VPPNIQEVRSNNANTEPNEAIASCVERAPVLASIHTLTPPISKRKTSIQVENIMLKKRKRYKHLYHNAMHNVGNTSA